MDAWLTPDTSELTGGTCAPLLIPIGGSIRAAVEGALLLLCDADNWEQFGTATPDDCAAAMSAMYLEFAKRETCMPIGSILWLAHSTLPDYVLACDGAEVAQADYPALYALIGDTFGTADTGKFKLPDMAGRYATGGTSGTLGDTVGANSLTLSQANLPAHTHTTHTHLANVAVSPGELPITTPGVGVENTGSTGSGTAIDNRPASLKLIPCIVVR